MENTTIALLLLTPFLLSAIWVATNDYNPIYANECRDTNFTHLSMFATTPDNGATQLENALGISVNCMKSLCIYNKDKISESYRKEVC